MADPRETNPAGEEQETSLICPECKADLRSVGFCTNIATWVTDFYSFDDDGHAIYHPDDQQFGDTVDFLDRDIECGSCRALITGESADALFELADNAEYAN